jgi:hypothetical protein
VTEAAQIRVFLSGEDSSELGSRIDHPAYQTDDRPGVLHALLRRIQASGWAVGGACEWKRIRKYRAGGAAHADTHNVLGVALDAKEAGCQVLAFSRDVDNDSARRQAIEDGIALVPQTFEGAPAVVGGAAVPKLEAWILALLGVSQTESLSPKGADEALAAKGVPPKDRHAMVEVVEKENVAAVPRDATSLRTWLDRAEVLSRLVAGG